MTTTYTAGVNGSSWERVGLNYQVLVPVLGGGAGRATVSQDDDGRARVTWKNVFAVTEVHVEFPVQSTGSFPDGEPRVCDGILHLHAEHRLHVRRWKAFTDEYFAALEGDLDAWTESRRRAEEVATLIESTDDGCSVDPRTRGRKPCMRVLHAAQEAARLGRGAGVLRSVLECGGFTKDEVVLAVGRMCFARRIPSPVPEDEWLIVPRRGWWLDVPDADEMCIHRSIADVLRIEAVDLAECMPSDNYMPVH